MCWTTRCQLHFRSIARFSQCRSGLQVGSKAVSPLQNGRVSFVVDQQHMSAVSRYRTIRLHAGCQDVPHQLVVPVQRAGDQISIAIPMEKTRHIAPLQYPSLG